MVNNKFSAYMFFLEVIKVTNTWRRLLVLCALLIFCTVGGACYLIRDNITIWLNSYMTTPVLKIGDMEILASKVIKDMRAVKATVWNVDLADNYREIIYSRDKIAEQTEEEGTGGLLFTSKSGEMQLIVLLIEQNIFCFVPTKSNIQTLDDFDPQVKYVCIVQIPPGTSILGFMAVSFAEVPAHPELLRKQLLKATREIVKVRRI